MRTQIRAVYRLLGSRQLAITLMISWTLLLVVWVVPFIFYGLPATEINRIVSGELFFRLTYVTVLIATAACVSSRLPGLLRRVVWMPTAEAKPRTADSASAFLGGTWSSDRANDLLGALRVRRIVNGEGWVWGVKNRFSPMGTVLFHLSFFLIIGSAYLGLQPGSVFDGKTAITVGETFDSTKDEAFTDELTPEVKAPELSMTLLSLQPRFYEDILLFTKLEGVVRGSDGRRHRISVGSPWPVSPTTLVSIEDFGYSVTAEMRHADGSITGPSTYRLKAFPSEMEDSFLISGTGGSKRVDLRIFGDYVDRNGTPGIRSFNLARPRLLITVSDVLTTDGLRPIVSERIVSIGEEIRVGEDTLLITEIPYHGVFRVSRRSQAPLALFGVLLMCLGIMMRLVFPRIEILIVEHADGSAVFARDSTYRGSPALIERLIRTWEGLR